LTLKVGLKGGTSSAKIRSPVWTVVFTVITLGVYGAYWWYQVNREMRDVGRIHASPELGDSPGLSLLAVTLGLLVIVPPFVSLYRGCQRVQAAQQLAGVEERERLNGWIALALVATSFVIALPLVVAYVQSELNKVWANESIAERRVPVATVAQAPTASPPATADAPAAAATAQAATSQEPAPAVAPAAADPQLERLERLAALRDSGGITPEEYETQKASILDQL
jgi:Domain of unknown function (DUF4234)/Short C-terminal domain